MPGRFTELFEQIAELTGSLSSFLCKSSSV